MSVAKISLDVHILRSWIIHWHSETCGTCSEFRTSSASLLFAHREASGMKSEIFVRMQAGSSVCDCEFKWYVQTVISGTWQSCSAYHLWYSEADCICRGQWHSEMSDIMHQNSCRRIVIALWVCRSFEHKWSNICAIREKALQGKTH